MQDRDARIQFSASRLTSVVRFNKVLERLVKPGKDCSVSQIK